MRAASSARAIVSLAVALYATLALFAAVRVADALWPTYGLRVSAYASPDWSGRVVHQTIDSSLSDELLGAAPLNAWSRFSLEWTGSLAITESGSYTFALSSDDGSSLEIDGALVVDNGGIHQMRRVVGRRDLTTGVHPVRLRYFQDGGRSSLSVLWSVDGESFAPIPASRLQAEATTIAAYRLRLVPPIAAGLITLAGLALMFRLVRVRLVRAVAGPSATIDAVLAALERPGVAVAVVLVVGLAMRLAWLVSSPAILWPDSMLFYATMREIVGGDWTSHDAFRTLLYPQLLAALLWNSRTPEAGTVVVAVQQLMGLLSVVLVYAIGRRVFTPMVALAGALPFAVHSVQLVYELTIQTESLFTLMLLVGVWVALRWLDTPSAAGAILTGVSTAGLVLVRPVAQWFIVGLAALAAATMRPRRRGLALAAMAVAAYAVVIVPFMALNQRDYGFFGVSVGQGLGLYTRVFDIDALVPPTDTRYPEMRDLWAVARDQRWPPNRVHDVLNYERGHSASSADALMLGFARETVLRHPLRFAVTSIGRWIVQVASPFNSVRVCQSSVGAYLCSGRTEGESLPPFPNRPTAPSALRQGVVAFASRAAVDMRVVFVLALVGALAVARAPEPRLGAALLGLTILYTTLVPAVSQWPQDRYRLPVDGLLFLFAASGAAAIGRAVTPSVP